MKSLKFQITLQVTLHKERENGGAKYSSPISFNSRSQIFINKYIDNSLKLSYQTILSRIQNWFVESSGWIVESIGGDCINVSITVRLENYDIQGKA